VQRRPEAWQENENKDYKAHVVHKELATRFTRCNRPSLHRHRLREGPDLPQAVALKLLMHALNVTPMPHHIAACAILPATPTGRGRIDEIEKLRGYEKEDQQCVVAAREVLGIGQGLDGPVIAAHVVEIMTGEAG
jgi:hypothetical protein